MDTLLWLVLNMTILLCKGQDADKPLPSPNLVKITTFNPAGFTVEWDPVQSDEENPILGFKVKVWENEKETTYRPANLDGLEDVWIKELRPIENPIHVIPKTEPMVQDVPDANATSARFEDVKLNEDYQIRVQAYSDEGDGPYSNVLGIKMQQDEE